MDRIVFAAIGVVPTTAQSASHSQLPTSVSSMARDGAPYEILTVPRPRLDSTPHCPTASAKQRARTGERWQARRRDGGTAGENNGPSACRRQKLFLRIITRRRQLKRSFREQDATKLNHNARLHAKWPQRGEPEKWWRFYLTGISSLVERRKGDQIAQSPSNIGPTIKGKITIHVYTEHCNSSEQNIDCAGICCLVSFRFVNSASISEIG